MILNTTTDQNGNIGLGTNFGNIKDFFSRQNILSDSDMSAISAYNDEFTRLSDKVKQSGTNVSRYTIAQKAANNTMSNASEKAQEMVKKAKGNTVALDSLTKSSKASALGMKALSTAANMITFFGIAKGIELVVNIFDSLHTSTAEAKENLQESVDSFDETTQEIAELESELEGCVKRINELQKLSDNGTISIADQNELEKLKKTNDELERKIALKKEKQIDKAKEVLEDNKAEASKKVQSAYTYVEGTYESSSPVYKFVLPEDELATAFDMHYSGEATDFQTDPKKRIEDMYKEIKPNLEAYEKLINAGYELSDEESTHYDKLKKLQDKYILFRYEINGLKETYQALNAEQKRSILSERLEEQGLSPKNAKAVLDNISDEDLNSLWSKDFSFVPPELSDYSSVEEYGRAYAKAWLNGANDTASNQSFKQAWNSLDNTEDESQKTLKSDLISYATEGQLNEETFKNITGAEEWAQTINEPIDSVLSKINEYISISEQIDSLSDGMSALSNNLHTKTQKKGSFIASTELKSMPASLKKCTKEWNAYEKAMGSSKTSASKAKQVTDDLASAFVNNSGILTRLTNDNKDYYITQMKNIGIKNADKIVTDAIAVNEENLIQKKDALKLASEAVNGTITESSKAFLKEANMSDYVKAALMDLSAKETIFSNKDLSVEQKVDALNQLANAYFGVNDAFSADDIQISSAMGGDPRYWENSEDYNNAINEALTNKSDKFLKKKSKAKVDTDKDGAGLGKVTPLSNPDYKPVETKEFDYIQIKLDRLERKHTKYLEKAQDGTRSLTARTRSYNLALKTTEKQINAQSKIISKYKKKLNKIGLDGKTASKIRNGAFKIENLTGSKKEKAEKYQTLYEKLLEAKKSKESLKKETQRDKIQLKVDDLEEKRKNEESKEKKLKNIVGLKEKTGNTQTGSDYKKINSSLSNQISLYKQQITQMKKQLNSLNVGTAEWYKYKDAIDSVKDSINNLTIEMLENSVKGIETITENLDNSMNKLDDEDELNSAKANNALTADDKNSYNDKFINNVQKRKEIYTNTGLQYNSQIANAKNLIKKTSGKVKKSEKNTYKAIKSYINKNQKIPDEIMEDIKDENLYANCYSYNEALTAYDVNEAKKALYQETSKDDIKNAVLDSVDNLKNESDNRMSTIDMNENDLDADIKKKEISGVGMSREDYIKTC